jgi:predicted tellurium resistance membrane protein TerC
LNRDQRRKGIIFGCAAAVIFRVALTFFVSQLLQVRFLKLIGGGLILWIAVKLFIAGVPEDKVKREATTVPGAVKVIAVADITMSLDNMPAEAALPAAIFFYYYSGLG